MPTVIQMEFQFPNPSMVMAKLRFEVELSSVQNIRWEKTQKGLLDFFAICSHETYLKLNEALKEKCNSGL